MRREKRKRRRREREGEREKGKDGGTEEGREREAKMRGCDAPWRPNSELHRRGGP